VAKVDCEGCEYGLLLVPSELLKHVDLWIIKIYGVLGILV